MASTAAAHLGEDPLLLACRPAAGCHRAGSPGSRRRSPARPAATTASAPPGRRGRVVTPTTPPGSSSGSARRPAPGCAAVCSPSSPCRWPDPDLVEALVASPSTPLRARSAWSRGDSGLAVDLLAGAGAEGDSLLAAGYRSALTLQAPGTRLVPPRLPRGTGRGSPTTGAPAAFHVLTNSLPHSRAATRCAATRCCGPRPPRASGSRPPPGWPTRCPSGSCAPAGPTSSTASPTSGSCHRCCRARRWIGCNDRRPARPGRGRLRPDVLHTTTTSPTPSSPGPSPRPSGCRGSTRSAGCSRTPGWRAGRPRPSRRTRPAATATGPCGPGRSSWPAPPTTS